MPNIPMTYKTSGMNLTRPLTGSDNENCEQCQTRHRQEKPLLSRHRVTSNDRPTWGYVYVVDILPLCILLTSISSLVAEYASAMRQACVWHGMWGMCLPLSMTGKQSQASQCVKPQNMGGALVFLPFSHHYKPILWQWMACICRHY